MLRADWRQRTKPAVRAASCAWLICLSGHVSAEPGCKPSVRWNEDAPYTFRGSDGMIQGIFADLVSEALRRMACEPRWVEMPWARALIELEGGRLDILPGTLPRPEREAFAHFSMPINQSANTLFVSKAALSRFELHERNDLLNPAFRLGVQISVSYGKEFDTLLQNAQFAANLTKISGRTNGWQMIAAGRLDGMIADRLTGQRELETLGLAGTITPAPLTFPVSPSSVAFSRKTIDRAFVERFDRQMAAMMKDGTYVKLYERHINCKVSVTSLGCR